MQRKLLATLVVGLFRLPAHAQEAYQLGEIVVTATRIPTPDVLAPYASEVHTRRQIEQSGATSLYDYLAQHTSVNVLPNYGNRFTPKLDMRGYGIGDGYQNIVVTVDGQRLNNIDLMGPLIGAIPMADIERIEITKGSGSVMFGDGATAGSIQIITRAHNGVSVSAGAGNFGVKTGTVTAGITKDRLKLSASADYSHTDGHSEADTNGKKDTSNNRTWRGGLELQPLDPLKFGFDLASTRIETRYVGPLSLAEFNANPAQNSGNTYTPQRFDSDLWRIHARLDMARNWQLVGSHSEEDKRSEYLNGWGASDYDYVADDVALQFRGDALDITMGMQTFDGTRIGADNRTRKHNTGGYVHGQYRSGNTILSAGARTEKVEYRYAPTAGSVLSDRYDLNAWDIGINHRLSSVLFLFANYNRAFQAPDIDRFFNFGGTFNGFIQPAISHTFNLGLNHVTAANTFKLTLFRSNLDNEIYYYNVFPGDKNTNLDKTHKYGLELQDTWRATETVSANLNYTWTRAVIDRENEEGGAYNGKDLPGVPRHGINLSLNWQPARAWQVNLTHAWRSQAYAADDFANEFSQKQAAYQATNLALRYQRKNLEWSAGVENLFEHKNGIFIKDDAIYPVNFTRNWRIGLKAQF